MLLPSQKPSSSYSLLKFVYVIDQLRHPLVLHPLLRKILDPPLPNFFKAKSLNKPLHCMTEYLSETFQGRYLDLYPAMKYVRELRKYKYKFTKAIDLADQCFVSDD